MSYVRVCVCVCALQAGYEGFVIDQNGRSFTGKLGPDLKLCGKVNTTVYSVYVARIRARVIHES